MKLSLGTAQFGLTYGISNNGNKVSKNEISRILDFAYENNIDTLDTAPIYGEAEKIMGEIGVGNFKVISKVPKLSKSNKNSADDIKNTIEQSLENLRISHFEAILFHFPEDLYSSYGSKILECVIKLKSDLMIKKIGISLYDIQNYDNLSNLYNFDIIQIPFNIFDQRLILKDNLAKVKQKNIEVHIRSIFLQGLLLTSKDERPEYFLKWKDNFDLFEQWLVKNKLSALEACIRFVKSFNEVDSAIVGVQDLEQLKQIVSINNKKKGLLAKNLRIDDPKIIDPTNWKF